MDTWVVERRGGGLEWVDVMKGRVGGMDVWMF